MSITDTSTLLRGNPPQKRTSVRFCLVRHFQHFPWHSDFCFPRSTNKPVLLSCHLYAACRNAIDRLLKRPSFISLAVTATSYMEGSQPFIYKCAPRGTRTCHCPAGIVKNIISNVFKKNWEGGTRTCPDDYFPSIIFTRSSNELRSRASTFISRILPCLSVILYVGNELIWR